MKELLILRTIEVSLLFQGLMISRLFGMEKEAILTRTPSNQFLAAIPSSVLACPSVEAGNVNLESEDGEKRITIARGAAEQSETLKNVISEAGTTQSLPVCLNGDLFIKLVNALKALYEYQGINAYQLSYPLESIVSGMSFNDLMSLFRESNRLNIPALTWYIGALFATELYQNKNVDQVAAMTKEIASTINGSDLITALLNNALDKKTAERLATNIKILAEYEIPIQYSVVALKELPNKNLVALTGSEDGKAYFWNLTISTKEPQKILKGHTESIAALAFSPEGNFALTGSYDGTARYWDLTTGETIKELIGHNGLVTSVAFSSDGNFALTGSRDGTARYWDLKTGQAIKILRTRDTTLIASVAISKDAKQALTGLYSDTAYLWDLKSEQIIKTLKGHLGRITYPGWGYLTNIYAVEFSPDDKYALTGSGDQKAMVWDLKQEGKELKPLKILAGARSSVKSVAFSADGKRALTGSLNSTARLWDLDTAKIIAIFKAPRGNIDTVVFGLNDQSILTAASVFDEPPATVYQWILRSLNKLPQVTLFIKLKELDKKKVLANPYFKKIYDELSQEIKGEHK